MERHSLDGVLITHKSSYSCFANPLGRLDWYACESKSSTNDPSFGEEPVTIQSMLLFMTAVLTINATVLAEAQTKKTPAALNFTMESLDGESVSLSRYANKVVLIVNVASQCGLTDQYEQLQMLHVQYGKKGLAVVGVPCNQFGGQEPGSATQIQAFCKSNYGVTFDMLAKVEVNGEKACGLYKHLTSAKTKPKGPGKVVWNFEKFLLDRNGDVIGRFDPNTSPDDEQIVNAIEKALAE